MKRILSCLAVVVLSVAAAAAEEKPASEASIKELLVVSEVRKLLDNMIVQMDSMMKGAMQQMLQGKEITPALQKIVDKNRERTMALLKAELSWEQMEPLYVKVYQQAFTQEELDGILAFYRTPAGKALVKKTPVVMEKTMAAMQERMGPMIQKLEKIQQEIAAEIAAETEKQPAKE